MEHCFYLMYKKEKPEVNTPDLIVYTWLRPGNDCYYYSHKDKEENELDTPLHLKIFLFFQSVIVTFCWVIHIA